MEKIFVLKDHEHGALKHLLREINQSIMVIKNNIDDEELVEKYTNIIKDRIVSALDIFDEN